MLSLHLTFLAEHVKLHQQIQYKSLGRKEHQMYCFLQSCGFFECSVSTDCNHCAIVICLHHSKDFGTIATGYKQNLFT